MEQVQPSPKYSPTRYMLLNQNSEEKPSSMIDYSYNPYSPAACPIFTKKRKRVVKNEKAEKKANTKIKQKPEGKTFHEVPLVVKNGEIVEAGLERSLILRSFWTGLHSNGNPYHLVLLKPLQNPLGIRHHHLKGKQRSCTPALCI